MCCEEIVMELSQSDPRKVVLVAGASCRMSLLVVVEDVVAASATAVTEMLANDAPVLWKDGWRSE